MKSRGQAGLLTDLMRCPCICTVNGVQGTHASKVLLTWDTSGIVVTGTPVDFEEESELAWVGRNSTAFRTRNKYGTSNWLVEVQNGYLVAAWYGGDFFTSNSARLVYYRSASPYTAALELSGLPITLDLISDVAVGDELSYTVTGFPSTVTIENLSPNCTQPVVCDDCEDPAPCAYAIILDCTRRVVFRKLCFNDTSSPCLYYSLNSREQSGLDGEDVLADLYHVPPDMASRFQCTTCTWETTIDATHLVLDPVAGTISPTAYSEYPDFPSYTLVGDFNCKGCSVFVKDAPDPYDPYGGDNPYNMPSRIEVVPLLESAAIANCAYVGTVDGITHYATTHDPLCSYASEDVRKACCDPCCDCVSGFVQITGCCLPFNDGIDGDLTKHRVTWCYRGDEATEAYNGDAAGKTREAEFSFTDCADTVWDIKLVLYCDGTNWHQDIYYKENSDPYASYEYFDTIDVDVECCPFEFAFELPEFTFAECISLVTSACCPCDIPKTLYLTITGTTCGGISANVGVPFPIYWDDDNGGWQGSFVSATDGLIYGFRLNCTGTDCTSMNLGPPTGTNAIAYDCTISPAVPTSCQCLPVIRFEYGSTAMEGAGGCCNGAGPGSMSFVVTSDAYQICDETVETDCCPDDDVPNVLYGTVSNVSGCDACYSGGSFTIEFYYENGRWTSSFSFPGCASVMTLYLQCNAGPVWHIDTAGCENNVDSGFDATATQCAPFELQFSLSNMDNDCCGGTGTSLSFDLLIME